MTADAHQFVYVIFGHNEEELSNSCMEVLERLYLSADLELQSVETVTDDAVALIINAPTMDFSSEEAQKVLDYLSEDGNVLVTTSCEASGEMPNFDSILNEYGIEIQRGCGYGN